MLRRYIVGDDGYMAVEVSYKHGVKDGPAIVYHPNGNIKDSIMYRDGKMHGTRTMYRPDGVILGSSEFKNGILDGISKRKKRKSELDSTTILKNKK